MNKEQAQHVLDAVKERTQWLEDHVLPRIEEMNPESKPLRKPDVPAFAEYMIEQYPPEPFIFPDGHVEVGSAWGLALRHSPNITNAREILRQLEGGLK